MAASLSVTHGFLPPHPSPTALVGQFNANMGTTLIYGIIIAIPTVIIAGPLFSRALKGINATLLKTFQSEGLPDDKLPSLTNSILTALLPVMLLTITTVASFYVTDDSIWKGPVGFLSDASIVMLISLGIATYTLGLSRGMKMTRIMELYVESVKDVCMIVLIMGGAGALKQVLIESGVSNQIAGLLDGISLHPLVLGWLIAAIIRICVGSATVAGLTAAGIVAPLLLAHPEVNPNLMVLAVGAGSLMFSHLNDSGFWLFKEYFNLSIKDTIKSWSMLETIVSICGLIGVLALNAIL
jgi:Gnt-I system high-affinity gluconate transporter